MTEPGLNPASDSAHDYFAEFFPRLVGDLIRQAREDAGLTQAQLAQAIDRHQASLSGMETGKMEPNASTLFKLAAVLKRPVNAFFPNMQGVPRLEGITEEEFDILAAFNRLGGVRYRSIALAMLNALHEEETREDKARYEALLKEDPYEAERYREWLERANDEAALRAHELKQSRDHFRRTYPQLEDDEAD